ncbi:MAG TPA: type II secretion system F family protein [Acidimicrobiales bacterium]|nr:type II secretion system F family protein [Acidimicrobiales bacterium]
MRLAVAAALTMWIGTTLLLAEVRWFSRPTLTERLRPFVPGAATDTRRTGALSVDSFRDVIAPIARTFGSRMARAFGVRESLDVRLERVHSPLDASEFRVKQLSRMVLSLGVAAAVTLLVQPPAVVALLGVLGAPVLAFLVVEQQLAAASARWQRRLQLELPVVAEQLAMLLGAGYSLGSALQRIAERGTGAAATDLARVMRRIRQGVSDVDALREWADVADVKALHRLVPVLALNRDASDLGRLLGEEARGIRRDAQREFVETMERRLQSVWIPVTVATLVPGAVFLAIPFLEALRLFSS